MIKLNLLPSHIFEMRRIIITVVVFAVLFALEWGFLFKFKADVLAQSAWYTTDTTRVKGYQTDLDKYASDETAFKGYPDVYKKWLETFDQLQPYKVYTGKIAVTMAEAAKKLAGGGVWFKTITIANDGGVTAAGKIKGSMQFLNYYFRIRDLKGTLTTLAPAVKVDPKSDTAVIDVNVTWPGAATAFPTPPTLPDSTNPHDSIFKPAGGGAAAAGK